MDEQTLNSGPKRVLMTADTLGGVWSYALELAAALGKYGVKVGLATMGAPLSRAQRVAAASLRNVEVYQSHFRLEWMEQPWGEVDRAGHWLLELEKAFVPDMVHLNGYVHAALGWRAPVMVVAHSCVLSWWQAVKAAEAPASFDEYRARVRLGLNAAGAIVAPTRAMLGMLESCHGALSNTHVIANGINSKWLRPGPKQCRLLAAGRMWDECKGFELLDAAAEALSWPVLLAGDKGAGQSFANLHLLGMLSRKEMLAQYKAASIFVAPALYEPFGLAALEAALCGCALVLSDLPSFRETWGNAAQYFRAGDHDSLSAALKRVVAERALRAELACMARKRALKFGAQEMACAYMEIYRQLCQ